MNRWLVGILILACVLRLPFLGSLPALYTDEASLGYNAWSMLETGKDEYAELFPASLRSFGDWKPPLSAYVMMPFIAVFGLNEWAIRLPSLISGIGTILLVYILLAHGFNSARWGRFAALSLAITPWHIHQSRMAMLVGPSLFFLTLGVTGWVLQDRSRWWRWLSVVGFAGAIYGYYGARLIVPLLLLFLWLQRKGWRQWSSVRRWVWPIVFGLLLLAPLGIAFFSNQEVLFGRARYVSVFADPGVNLKIWDDTASDGNLTKPLIVRFWHNKPFAYTADILYRYTQHVDGRFLFLHGSRAEPFELPRLGELLWITIPFVLMGTAFLVIARPSGTGLIVAWMLIAIVPAALTFMTPASNRSFFMIVPLAMVAGYGLERTVIMIRRYRIVLVAIVVLFIANVIYFSYQYYVRLPLELGDKYRYGLKEVVRYVTSHVDHYEKIVLSPAAGHYIYFLVYTREDPIVYQETRRLNETLDKFGFEHVDGYGKYEFRRSFSWKDEPKHQGILFVAADYEVPGDVPIGYNVRHTVYYPNGKPAYRIFDL